MAKTDDLGRAAARVAVAVIMVAFGLDVVAPTPAAAASITVDISTDTTNGGDGLTSLREAFAMANANAEDDTILLSPGTTYTLADCLNGPLTHTASEALTIQGGPGTVIHQTCSDVGVVASTDTSATSVLTIDSVTITGSPNTGATLDGAAVFADGRLVLDGVTITDIEAGPGGSVVHSTSSPGGGVTISIAGSTITGNQGTAISGDFVSVSVTDSTISDNVGSGISLVDGTPLTITETTISGNSGRGASTTGQGSTAMTVQGALVSGNGAGGLSCSACMALSVSDSIITGNGLTAGPGTGGGVSFTFDYDPVPADPYVRILDSTITGNRADRPGAGISVGTIEPASNSMSQPITDIWGSTISDNWTVGADQHGAGIDLRTTSARITGSQITGNVTGLGQASGSADGGGLRMVEAFDDGIADGTSSSNTWCSPTTTPSATVVAPTSSSTAGWSRPRSPSTRTRRAASAAG